MCSGRASPAIPAQLLATLLIQYERLRGVRSSGVLIIFWFLCMVCGIIPFRSKILSVLAKVRGKKGTCEVRAPLGDDLKAQGHCWVPGSTPLSLPGSPDPSAVQSSVLFPTCCISAGRQTGGWGEGQCNLENGTRRSHRWMSVGVQGTLLLLPPAAPRSAMSDRSVHQCLCNEHTYANTHGEFWLPWKSHYLVSPFFLPSSVPGLPLDLWW